MHHMVELQSVTQYDTVRQGARVHINSAYLKNPMRILSFLLSLVTVAAVSTCGGNCPGGNCPACPCGSTKSVQDITSWCAQFSGWNQANCRCIMSHESGGNANAVGYNTDGSYDVGLWQINDFNWGACSGGSPPCGPSANLACAKKVYAWGSNTWKLWSTCRTCGCCSSA